MVVVVGGMVFTGPASSGRSAPATPATVSVPVTSVRISQLPSGLVPPKLIPTQPGSASHWVKHEFTSGTVARFRIVPISLVPQVTLNALPYDESHRVTLLAVAPQVTAGHLAKVAYVGGAETVEEARIDEGSPDETPAGLLDDKPGPVCVTDVETDGLFTGVREDPPP